MKTKIEFNGFANESPVFTWNNLSDGDMFMWNDSGPYVKTNENFEGLISKPNCFDLKDRCHGAIGSCNVYGVKPLSKATITVKY
jgi:hypothetical protein